MIGVPKLENHAPQTYLGIRTAVKMQEIGKILPSVHNRLADWMESRAIEPSGAPFFRYLVIDPGRGFEMEVGVPTAVYHAGEGEIRGGTLPGGCYAVMIHAGHFSGLFLAAQAMLEWADKNGIEWQMGRYGNSEAWEARLETYLNVGLEKNPEKWQTELAFLTAGETASEINRKEL